MTACVRPSALIPTLVLALCCWTGAALPCLAHPVSVTRAQVYVSREKATAEIQVFLEDLFLFHNLKPNNEDFLEPNVIQEGIKLHKEFIANRFVIQNTAGVTLNGRIVEVKGVDKLPDEGVPLAELMAHRLVFELEYEFPSPPKFLTFSQHFTDKEGLLPSEMKLIVKQENTEQAHTFDMRPGDVQTVPLIWDRPPLSPDASREEREKWAAEQKEETLGITSYSSVYSFLYIENHEVRHEILIPLLTLEQSVLLARDEDDFLDLAEQDAARVQIEAFFKSGNPVEIDGSQVSPVVQRCDFYGLDFKDFARQAQPKAVPLTSARVGIILSYPTATPPETVKLTWNRYNNSVWAVDLVVFAHDKTIKTTLSRLGNKSTFEWKSPGRTALPVPPKPVAVVFSPRPALSVPVLSLVFLLGLAVALVAWLLGMRTRAFLLCCGVCLLAAVISWPFLHWQVAYPLGEGQNLSEEQADEIFHALHQNMYGAFEFRQEEQIYDSLAVSIHGDLLRDLYLQVRRGLVMQEQGGAVARVREVSILEGKKEKQVRQGQGRGGPGVAYRCRWNVAGTVEHWGHIHERTNQYLANFTVEPIDNTWKITNMELLDEQRVQFETRLRGL
jgi:hypothetical protein